MSVLDYKKKTGGELLQESSIFHVESVYDNESVRDKFQNLKANVCDLNPALVTKCITGTEQDFIMLMKRASDYLDRNFLDCSEDDRKLLLEMFSHSVFGYYVLTPLIMSKEVSDIKVLDYNHVVVKASGERYHYCHSTLLQEL